MAAPRILGKHMGAYVEKDATLLLTGVKDFDSAEWTASTADGLEITVSRTGATLVGPEGATGTVAEVEGRVLGEAAIEASRVNRFSRGLDVGQYADMVEHSLSGDYASLFA